MATHGRPEGLHYLLVAAFVGVISLPLAANLAGRDGADGGAENRELASFPHVDGSWASVAAFGPGLSDWFDDHFGFRSTLVRWYGESRLFVLGVSPSAAVVKGEGGWFFYGDDTRSRPFQPDPDGSGTSPICARKSSVRSSCT